MADPTTLDKVKLALRISHTSLDTDIQATINTAKAELGRAGILSAAIVETDALILDAIKTYCKYSYASDENQREGFFQSWQYQLDCLRKSRDYCEYKVTFTVKTSGAVAIDKAQIDLDIDRDGITDTTLYTNSAGVASYYTRYGEINIDYTVSKSGYSNATGTVYVDGTEAVAVTMT